MSAPLEGVRILDMTSIVMGPYATQILADLGADVVKVESPQGDLLRGIGPARNPGMGPLYLHLNRNKRSVVLDLKRKEGRVALLKLAEKADVLAYNVRPKAMQRLGLSYEEVKAINPGIIYAGMFGFSQRGPYAAEAAFDDLIQAATALPSASAIHSGGIPRYLPITIGDRTVGLYAMGMILAALYQRTHTRKGQAISIPMFETMTQFVMGDHLYGQTFDPPRGEFGYPRLLAPQRRPYPTKDGHLCCLVYTDAQWQEFLRRVGKIELLQTDPRFKDIHSRTAHINALYEMVAGELAGRTTAECMALLKGSGITLFPLHTFESLLHDPHLEAIGFFREIDHPTEGRLRSMAVPSEWSGSEVGLRRHAPRLGEHSVAVLREAGYSEEQVAGLIANHVTKDGR